MRIYAGIGLVLLLEVAALVAAALWRVRADRRRDRFADTRHLTAVLEVEDADGPLPTGRRKLPGEIIRVLRDDPMLGLADVHVVRQIQHAGDELPDDAPAAVSYQGLNEALGRVSEGMGPEPVPAMRWTWLELRLELPGSRNRAWAFRAAKPIEARGGGRLGAARTLDKAVGTATARLGAAGFVAMRLAGEEARSGLATSVSFSTSAGHAGTPWPLGKRPARTADAPREIPVPPGGLVLGLDPTGKPVVLALFRRRPQTVTLVAGLHLAQVLALRAAATGARVILETARADAWDPVVRDSGLDADRIATQHVGRVAGNPGWPGPSPAAPLLVIRDCGARPPYASIPHGPWVTVVTLLPFLDARTAGQLGHADLVGFQRLAAEEAALARRALALADRDAEAMADLPDDAVLWRAKGRMPRWCEVTGTAWELRLLGPAHR